MTDVLLLEDDPADYLAAWSVLAPGLRLRLPDEPGASACRHWLGRPDRAAALLRRGGRPEWLQSIWAGYTPLLAPDLPRDYRFSRAVGLFGQSIAEYALTYLLQQVRQVDSRRASQARGQWDARAPGTLAGLRLLVVGAGDIGQTVARLLAPFGVVLIGIVRTPRPLPAFDRVLPLDALTEAAKDVDAVLNLLPDTPATADLYDAVFFAALPAGTLFINAGRGNSLVEADLLDALGRGHLGGAVLDVFREEPLPADHPFWTAPRLTLTAHVAGPTQPAAAIRLFLENHARLERGTALRGAVEWPER